MRFNRTVKNSPTWKKISIAFLIIHIAFLTIFFPLRIYIFDYHISDLVLENNYVSVGVDLSRGGAINCITLKNRWGEENIVNINDEGRYIQQSYYAGNNLDRIADGQSPSWSPWPWNPIQVGDAFGNRAETLESSLSEGEIYVKCIPMLWDMNNEPAEAIMEQWMELNDHVITVRCRLTCNRTDDLYGEGIERDQEVPAVYPVSYLSRLVSYRGAAPFTGAPVEELEVINLASGFWGRYDDEITENWMAFVDEDNYGLAVYNNATISFIAGRSGESGQWSRDGGTSYIAPVTRASLYKDSVYEYTYYLIVGELDAIRADIYEIHNSL
ncbi:MAG: hypothetical protein ACFFCS_16470 [Candidatus Hodarchaeota archaeon]